MAATPAKHAYVTLITSENYLIAVITLDFTLRQCRSKYPLICMVTSAIPADALQLLAIAGIQTKLVDYLLPNHAGNYSVVPRFRDTWTKLATFKLLEYDRICFLDADIIVRQNIDHLLDTDRPANSLAASHVCSCNINKKPMYPKDWIPVNCAHTYAGKHDGQPPTPGAGQPRTYDLFNSGLLVFQPTRELEAEVLDTLNDPIVQDFLFPDQDLLAYVFNKDNRFIPLPYVYNAIKTMRPAHPNLWRDEDVKVVHLIQDKPWEGGKAPEGTEILYEWWWTEYEGAQEEWIRKGLPQNLWDAFIASSAKRYASDPKNEAEISDLATKASSVAADAKKPHFFATFTNEVFNGSGSRVSVR